MPDINSLAVSSDASSQGQTAGSSPTADVLPSQQRSTGASSVADLPSHPPSSSTAALRSHLRRTSSSASSTTSPTRHPRPYNAAELHQELEREQEAVVNRLLHQIRTTAESINASNPNQNSNAILDDSSTPTNVPNTSSSLGASNHPRALSGSLSHSRHNSLSVRSRTSSRTSSPVLQPFMLEPMTDPFVMGGRDEVTFYKTETDMLTRENEMLKRRIRELEEQAARKTGGPSVKKETE